MPLFSAVLSLFKVNETSPSQQESESLKDSGLPSRKVCVSPGQSPKLLQKLNRMHGNSAILNNAGTFSPMKECKYSKKRTRECSDDDDGDEESLSNQKRRRIYVSESDDLNNTISIDSNNSQSIPVPNTSLENTKTSVAHETEFKLDAGVELTSKNETETKNSEKKSAETRNYQCNDAILCNGKDVNSDISDMILNTNSAILEDEKLSKQETSEDKDLSKVSTKVDRDLLKAVTETSIDEVFSTPSSSIQQLPEEMKCDTVTSENKKKGTSNGIFNDNNGVRFTDNEKQPTSDVLDESKKYASISENVDQPTASPILDDSKNDTTISEDVNQLTSRAVLYNGKDDTKDTDNESDNQLVPDLIIFNDEDRKTVATDDDQEVIKTEDEGNENDKDRMDICGDQVVDENNNEEDVSHKTEEEEKKMQEQLIVKQISEGILTDAMVDQEKKLHQEHLEEEKEIATKAMEEWETTVEKQRYSRLQHLLQKSNIYSSFLLQRIEEQKVENEKRRLRTAKKTEKAKNENDKESPQTVPHTRRGRRKKNESTSYNITDYVDTEALRKSSKESITTCVPEKDDKNFHIGHHSKETDTSQSDSCGYERPQLMTGGSLRDYQKEGVEWLKVLYENGVNGILADEMGLGKTIQCIAVIAHLMEKGVRGPFLVVAPLSTLPNWAFEFKRFTPGICTVLYHGLPEERAEMRKKFSQLHGDTIKSFPVAITSYHIIMNDRRHLVKYMWKYIIVDEGHRLKNLKCRLIRELKAFPSANRLVLTGTPLQNNLSELWSLLNFLLPDIFNDLDSFQAWFDFSAIRESDGNEKIVAQEREHHVLERLHAILTPFLLRRLKSDVSLEIPRKKEVFVYAPITQKQNYWYQLCLDKTRLLNELKPEKEVTPSYTPSGRTQRSCIRSTDYSIFDDDKIDYEDLAKILTEDDERRRESQQTVLTPETCERNVKVVNLLMMLRKACNHPYLLEYPLDAETQDYRVDEEVITCCGKTLVLGQMLPELKRRGHKVLLFSQMTKMLNILEDFCYLHKYNFSRIDGGVSLENRKTQIEEFNNDPDVFIFLLSTRAGGLGLNLTAADTVIIYDSDWNPQQDLQAQDRCHRIGQTKPVVVYRILTANTVDQKIVERANEKRRLEKMVIHKEKFKGRRDEKKLTSQDLMELLQSSDHIDAIDSDDINNTRVLSAEQLNRLMDRSDLFPGSTMVSENTKENYKLFKVIGIDE